MQHLKIGQLARQAAVGVETIRFYERRGLLAQPLRRASGYRQYTDETVSRLRFIRRAKELGFTLSEIAELLDLRVRAGATRAEVKQRAASKIADIERKIHDLQAMRESLVQLSKTCQGDGPAIGCPILEALNQPPASNSSKLPKTQATIRTRRAAKHNAASARS